VSRTPLRMPKMSMTMAEGELATWHVSVGDVVAAGQVVCEVMTDKVDMEVEATAAGTVVELVAEPGDTVPVGEPLAWLEATSDGLLDDLLDGDPPAPAAAAVTAAPGRPTAPPARPAGPDGAGIVPAIPRARRLAAENGVDLLALTGSGSGGAVLVSDVRAHLDRPDPARFATSPPATAPAPDADADADADALWAARAAALAPRPGPAGTAATVWRDAVLPGTAPPDAGALRTALAVALSHALAAEGPPHVRPRPRAGLAVPTPAGPVTVTFSDLHRLPPDAARSAVDAAVGQAERGSVDVGLLSPPDAVAAWVPDADRVAPPAPDGPLVTVAAGAAAPRVVPVGDGIGVRAVVTLGATATPAADVGWTARLLAHVARELTADLGRRPRSEPVSMTESSRS